MPRQVYLCKWTFVSPPDVRPAGYTGSRVQFPFRTTSNSMGRRGGGRPSGWSAHLITCPLMHSLPEPVAGVASPSLNIPSCTQAPKLPLYVTIIATFPFISKYIPKLHPQSQPWRYAGNMLASWHRGCGSMLPFARLPAPSAM